MPEATIRDNMKAGENVTEKEILAQLAREVRIEDLRDLHPATKLALQTIGVDAFVEVAHAVGGVSIYIPKFESVIAAARDRLIAKEYTKGNYTDLALKYNISEAWVRNIINRKRLEENSISLFDEGTG